MKVGDTVRYYEHYEDEEGFFVDEGQVLAFNGDSVTLTSREEGEAEFPIQWLETHITDAELGHHGV
jgi:hypothetical protein